MDESETTEGTSDYCMGCGTDLSVMDSECTECVVSDIIKALSVFDEDMPFVSEYM